MIEDIREDTNRIINAFENKKYIGLKIKRLNFFNYQIINIICFVI